MNKKECLNIFERYLQQTATEAEINKLRTFIASDLQLSQWLEKEIMESPADIDTEIKMRMLHNIRKQATLPRQTPQKRNYSIARVFAIAAAIFIPLVIAFTVYVQLQSDETGVLEIVTAQGEKASMILPDGSKVSLNAGSKITYQNDFNKKNRFLQLSGEGYFEVSPDDRKPFIVQCADIKIRVLGTTFGIKSYETDDFISVVLNSGAVQMITPTQNVTMRPNDRIVYNKKSQTTNLNKVNANDYTDWRYNRLRFESESLGEIMKTISRMHNVDIRFEDATLKERKFNGTLDNTSIESVLKTLHLTAPVNYKIVNDTIVLFEDGQQNWFYSK